jgi:hypothetical protein
LSRYVIYFLNDAGLTESFDVFEAADDEEAIALCERHRADHTLELWCGERRVATIRHDDRRWRWLPSSRRRPARPL